MDSTAKPSLHPMLHNSECCKRAATQPCLTCLNVMLCLCPAALLADPAQIADSRMGLRTAYHSAEQGLPTQALSETLDRSAVTPCLLELVKGLHKGARWSEWVLTGEWPWAQP